MKEGRPKKEKIAKIVLDPDVVGMTEKLPHQDEPAEITKAVISKLTRRMTNKVLQAEDDEKALMFVNEISKQKGVPGNAM
jgi:hypothetical protein